MAPSKEVIDWIWFHVTMVHDAGPGYEAKLDWLQDEILPQQLDQTICAAAAADNRLDVLQFLRQQQYPWDAATCTAAAVRGHLATLQWLRAETPPCPWEAATYAVAVFQGHEAVREWLRHAMPPHLPALCVGLLQLDVLKLMSQSPSRSAYPAIFVMAGIRAAIARDAELMQGIASLDAANIPAIVVNLLEEHHPDAVMFMHSLGCLGPSNIPQSRLHQSQIHFALTEPAAMCDLVTLQALQEVLEAHAVWPAALHQVSEGRRDGGPMPPQMLQRKKFTKYWRLKQGAPDFVAVAKFVMDHIKGHEQAMYWWWLCDVNICLAVELESHMPGNYCQHFKWPAASHSFAAAHVQPPALRWLLVQQGLAPEYTTVHSECSNARLLLLVHGHRWRLPSELAVRLTSAEQAHLVYFGVVKQQQTHPQRFTCLGSLPSELVKAIACIADIDFCWRHYASCEPAMGISGYSRVSIVCRQSG